MKDHAPVLPPSAGDIFIAAESQGWPTVTAAGVDVGPGEASWRRVVGAMSPDLRLRFWRARGSLSRQDRMVCGADLVRRREEIARRARLVRRVRGCPADTLQVGTGDAAVKFGLGELASVIRRGAGGRKFVQAVERALDADRARREQAELRRIRREAQRWV